MFTTTNGKAIAAFLVAVAVAAWPQLTGDHTVDLAEGIAIATAIASAVATYLVPLATGAPWLKTAVYAVLAALGTAATVVAGGINGDELLSIFAAAAAVFGVWTAPAASANGVAVGWGSDARTA
ncbi:hypothetical protein [Actinoplanes lobatus]|uniref:Putative membrane protein YccC n=1 Tax=Actinoplanes lobatus TaxID=113568 RepID=A0A7W7HRG4_9ACTN|nr:hypothetical protein [Actinoplanes lobatus]MBB4755289.1 putative membrane protein YccC [Actinoplanes lobatus]GIE46425.1 hypothetical protein Alo02nite_93230 [Actinoplanes lobatus]